MAPLSPSRRRHELNERGETRLSQVSDSKGRRDSEDSRNGHYRSRDVSRAGRGDDVIVDEQKIGAFPLSSSQELFANPPKSSTGRRSPRAREFETRVPTSGRRGRSPSPRRKFATSPGARGSISPSADKRRLETHPHTLPPPPPTAQRRRSKSPLPSVTRTRSVTPSGDVHVQALPSAPARIGSGSPLPISTVQSASSPANTYAQRRSPLTALPRRRSRSPSDFHEGRRAIASGEQRPMSPKGRSLDRQNSPTKLPPSASHRHADKSPSEGRSRSLTPIRRRGSPAPDVSKKLDRGSSRSPPPQVTSPDRLQIRRDRRSSRSPGRHRERTRTPPSRRRSRSPPRRRSPRRDRSPGGRDYSPRRRFSPGRYRGSRRRSPSRRPWSPPQNRSNGAGKPGNNLFIAGFNFITTERDLERKFSRYGKVMDVRIVRDKRSGESRGFGFLTLERDEDADAAIKSLDQTEWNGRIVLVEKAKTPTRF